MLGNWREDDKNCRGAKSSNVRLINVTRWCIAADGLYDYLLSCARQWGGIKCGDHNITSAEIRSGEVLGMTNEGVDEIASLVVAGTSLIRNLMVPDSYIMQESKILGDVLGYVCIKMIIRAQCYLITDKVFLKRVKRQCYGLIAMD